MISIVGEPGRPATQEEIKEFLDQNEKQPERTCKTCRDNDCGLCDRTGRLVDDDDTCENWKGQELSRREAMMRTFLAGH